MSRKIHLLGAAGEGALAGWIAGLLYGGWGVLLGRDWEQGFLRLSAAKLGAATLAGAVFGALVSPLLLLGIVQARRRGAAALRWLVLAGILVAGAAGYLAVFPWRERLLPLHIYSTKLLSLTILGGIGLCAGALALWRLFEPAGPEVGHRAALRAIAAAGGLLAFSSLVVQIVVPRLPLPPGATGRSILLISLDTLRGDRVGAQRDGRPLTESLDALARRGTLFEQATSAAPWTLPSHASLFTGRLPYSHGARTEHQALRPDLATLAERLRESGYRTGGFTGGGYVASFFGFDQGFEIYEDHDETQEGGPEPIFRAALSWIEGVGKVPFFAFVHTYEVHYPYTHADFVDAASRSALGPLGVSELEAIHRGERVLTPSEREVVKRLYDGDVVSADRQVGALLEALRKDGILDSLIVVVVSDHGEDLWDHDERRSPGHGHSLYEELLHVPMIVSAPGLVREGERIRMPVSLIDLTPTLLALAKLPGLSQAEGRSLSQVLEHGGEPESRPIVAESIEYGPDRFSRREGDLKIVLVPRPELYNSDVELAARPVEIFDLSLDPHERSSLGSLPASRTGEPLEALWRRVEAVFRPARSGPGKLAPELREQLRSLGYVQ
ncbi:MAG TPA: sulfatase [Candidatus Polarisedimenticolia bacterium]|nr:sulfatase [Candidatus Polarisedimenticolia bacterium]